MKKTDEKEIQILLQATSYFSETMENDERRAIIERICAGEKEAQYFAARAFSVALAYSRVKYLLASDEYTCAAIEEYPNAEIVRQMEEKSTQAQKADFLFDRTLPYLMQAFRYGYYQALSDARELI